jgi:hypothetical protein
MNALKRVTGDSFEVVRMNSADGPAVPPAARLGDLNGDGAVTVQDVTLSLRIAVGELAPAAAQKVADDANGDGKLNIQDATLILRYAVGLITTFPIR